MKKRGGLFRYFAVASFSLTGVLASASPRDERVLPEGRRVYAASEGAFAFYFDEGALADLGLRFVPQGELEADEDGTYVAFEVEPSSTLGLQTAKGWFDRFASGQLNTCGALLLDRPGERVVIGNLEVQVGDDGVLRIRSTLENRESPESVFELTSVMVNFDSARRRLQVVGEITVTEAWARRLAQPEAAGVALGRVEIDVAVVPADGRGAVDQAVLPEACDEAGSLNTGGVASVGPDVIVADLQSTIRYAPLGDITAFGVGTTACNIGTERANWISYTNQHPVIIQNLYRLKDNKFEQIGMSWVKHGFYAVSQSLCQSCLDPTDGSQLGVGCSDPYSASLNAVQTNMSPRSTVNANTGYFSYPWNGPAPGGTTIERRMQVHAADLDPALNPAARYFIEGHYVNPDDARVDTNDNNASYREVLVVNPSAGFFNLVINAAWSTQRGQPAVRAWRDVDPAVTETDVHVPNEGLFVLAAKVTNMGTGVWRYSYALQNLNSDRSARSFSVQLPEGAVVTNVGFHDVDYHSGEPYEQTPWQAEFADQVLSWSTLTFEQSPLANALRYSSTYSFYFDTNVQPWMGKVDIGLFKPGQPETVTATTVSPELQFVDCNRNNVSDPCDVDCNALGCAPPCGQSLDCNHNIVPDECEPDCNLNGIADGCDIADCPAGELWCTDCNTNYVPDGCEQDCDGDGLPDECDPPEDCDGDGVTDCYDMCKCTTPFGACMCPDIGLCCFSVGICIDNYPRLSCIAQGGTPDCIEAPCRYGCLIGDMDLDGDLDLADHAAYQSCFSGSFDAPGFPGAPSDDCLVPLDFDKDDDIDLVDHRDFLELLTGPRLPE